MIYTERNNLIILCQETQNDSTLINTCSTNYFCDKKFYNNKIYRIILLFVMEITVFQQTNKKL